MRAKAKAKIILLVEDNADDLYLALDALEKNNIRSEVVIARDGKEALDYLFGTGSHTGRDLSVMPAMILLDLKLPKVNGLEVLAQVRAHPLTALLPVIILTSSSEQQDIFSSYRLRSNSYIRKPVEFTQFKEYMRQIGAYWLGLNEVPPALSV